MRSATTRARRELVLLGALSLLAASIPASAQTSNATVVTAFTDVTIRCTGNGVPPPSGWAFTGLYGTNPNLRMKHASLSAYIPYSVDNPPSLVAGAGANRTYRLTATVLPADYANAYAGTYSDLLMMTVFP
jgi:hypothetical protein